MTIAATAVKPAIKSDPAAHRYDTSSYVLLKMQVKRDPLTGRLRNKEEVREADKSLKIR